MIHYIGTSHLSLSDIQTILLEDMKLNPKRYVHFSLFGKKNKPYGSEKLAKESSEESKN